jgi:8-oxo-dGTP pyrophosphatase MutT (NUDIX family)
VTPHFYRKQHVVTSVVAVIVDDAEQVVLTRRAVPSFEGLWVMPGGKIDLGEPIQVHAIMRRAPGGGWEKVSGERLAEELALPPGRAPG